MAIYYKNIPVGQIACQYDDLTSVAKQVAIDDVKNQFINAISHDLKQWKSRPLHTRINNRLLFLNLVDRKNNIATLNFEKIIKSNLCVFLKDSGTYVTFAVEPF
jgi:hypothetical protein